LRAPRAGSLTKKGVESGLRAALLCGAKICSRHGPETIEGCGHRPSVHWWRDAAPQRDIAFFSIESGPNSSGKSPKRLRQRAGYLPMNIPDAETKHQKYIEAT